MELELTEKKNENEQVLSDLSRAQKENEKLKSDLIAAKRKFDEISSKSSASSELESELRSARQAEEAERRWVTDFRCTWRYSYFQAKSAIEPAAEDRDWNSCQFEK